MASKLLTRTRELLSTTLIPMAKVARELGCSSVTLRLLRDGKHVPNVELCEAVYNFLSRDPLEVK
jgi:transcriptional regulator with XRE-family HTH domain